MCGIWGILSLNNLKYDLNLLFKKFNEIKYRGPDRSIFTINPNYIVGFHRLSIMDTSIQGDQPFSLSYNYKNDNGIEFLRTIYMTTNGEIYNFKEIKENSEIKEFVEKINYQYKSNSDCEVLLPLFLMTISENSYNNENIFENGIKEMLKKINGEFAFAVYDIHTNLDNNKTYYNLWAGRDRFGIRPMFYSQIDDNTIAIGSEMKSIIGINDNKVEMLDPRSWYYWGGSSESNILNTYNKLYYSVGALPLVMKPELDDVFRMIRTKLTESVKNRLVSDREVGCLLSGGLDSSLVSAIAAKELQKHGKKLRTFSIGMEGSPDTYYAKIVADHIGSIHTNIEIPEEEWLKALENVIKITETFDVTTIRATTGQYLVSKWISENTNIKVLLIGDGSDEATGGYLYFHKAPNGMELHFECKRLLHYIHYFDVLRADRGVSSNGLEARVPFLDHEFIDFYFRLDYNIRMPQKHKTSDNKIKFYEKYLIRKAFDSHNYLPECVLWRNKEAFSDGVSNKSKSWYEIIQDTLNYDKNYFEDNIKKYEGYLTPTTNEGLYYHQIFDKFYPNQNHICPYYWMPKWLENVNDPSARTLSIYKELEDNNSSNKSLSIYKELEDDDNDNDIIKN